MATDARDQEWLPNDGGVSDYVSKLLQIQGEEAAQLIQLSLRRSAGIDVMGQRFDAAVLKEALQRWDLAEAVLHGRGGAPEAAGTSTWSVPEVAGADTPSAHKLRALLSQAGVDCAACVEKRDLQSLWERFELLRSRPLPELRASCAAAGGPQQGSAEECARFLLTPDPAARRLPEAAAASPAAADPGAASGPGPARAPMGPSAAAACSERERDALREAQRIQGLRREAFRTAAAWGFAVLAVAERDLSAVHRGYRALMKKLHPDKAGSSPDVECAAESVRQAKALCERGLSRETPPGKPRQLQFSVVCGQPGRRRFKLSWAAPEGRSGGPVRKYVVAAVDPAYGKALSVGVLEPDYSEELKRFVSVDEMNSFVLAEDELQKMPKLWQQGRAQVQVAAANDAGQSPWEVLQVPLTGLAPDAVSEAGPPRCRCRGRRGRSCGCRSVRLRSRDVQASGSGALQMAQGPEENRAVGVAAVGACAVHWQQGRARR
ncbi:unnamed protein product [Prorocentrum cordatum]|uniref:J domain-containing protein n=1 Tax=Prorocentrum cordatum TaxID=2364126 RepID=A0ABN9RST1_9DINO|nr:unnamed protein product [Polarella glacialis]